VREIDDGPRDRSALVIMGIPLVNEESIFTNETAKSRRLVSDE